MSHGDDATAYLISDAANADGAYQHRARHDGFVVQRFWHREKELAIDRFCPPTPGEHVLDVGCGSGVVADMLARRGAVTIGVDADPRSIAFAQRTFARPNLEFRQVNVGQLDMPPASFDRIYSLELIEHLSAAEVRQFLERLLELAKPGGVLAITTPNYMGLWPAIEVTMDLLRLAPQMAGHQHVTRFHRRLLRRLLGESGWRVERLHSFSTFAPFASVLSWSLAERIAKVEKRANLPFGNILMAVARKPV